MAQQTIENTPSGGGDTLKDGADKINSNFTELYAVAPSANEKLALAGTQGTLSGTNEYVTNEDERIAIEANAANLISLPNECLIAVSSGYLTIQSEVLLEEASSMLSC